MFLFPQETHNHSISVTHLVTEKQTILKPSCYNQLERLNKLATGKTISLTSELLVLESQRKLSARAFELMLNPQQPWDM